MQTTVHFETENLEDAEVPIFVSLVAHPGFNTTCLESYGFFGDHDFFWGKRIFENESTTILKWGDEENQSSIQSRRSIYHDKNLVIKNKKLKPSMKNVGTTLMMSFQDLNSTTRILGTI